MCGVYQNPYEIARSLTIAATEHVVINSAGKSVDESNIELGRQVALIFKTILHELLHEELMRDGADIEFPDLENIHDHSHSHGHTHGHDHSHVHES
ncbi:MAG: hypothetical protein LBQ19_03080 [Synergistaceae bacterium]|jgi:hypothetical protein|nr:hypothetical protein [Synergistaceae bacterium]